MLIACRCGYTAREGLDQTDIFWIEHCARAYGFVVDEIRLKDKVEPPFTLKQICVDVGYFPIDFSTLEDVEKAVNAFSAEVMGHEFA